MNRTGLWPRVAWPVIGSSAGSLWVFCRCCARRPKLKAEYQSAFQDESLLRRRRRSVFFFLSLVVLIGQVRAEDGGARMTALTDPATECRYLTALWQRYQTATQQFQQKHQEFERAVATLPRPPRQGPAVERAERLKSESEDALAVAYRVEHDYFSVRSIIQAKRGLAEPCTSGAHPEQEATSLIPPVPPHSTAGAENSLSAAKPDAPLPQKTDAEKRLSDQKIELWNQYQSGQLTQEEYDQRRIELLRGL